MKLSRIVLAFTLLVASVYGCAETQKVEGAKDYDSGIRGQVFFANEGAAQGVFVYAYDSPFNDLRVPTKLISGPTADDGSYALKLPPGKYWIVARKRTTGDPKGYLVKGDYEGKFHDNPVEVKPGEYGLVNLSIIKLQGAFLTAPYLPDTGSMGISGKVYDKGGRPVRGAYILLYSSKDMIGMPAHLSRPTNNEGEYAIYLDQPGSYYVAARLKFGGLPLKGEPYGTYDKDPEHKVVVDEKEIVTGVDITLGEFPHDLTRPVPTTTE